MDTGHRHGVRLAFAAALLAVAPHVAAQVPATALVTVRVHLARTASDADVLRVRDNLVSFGGVIRGYAAGDVLVASLPPHALAAARSIHRVERVQPLAVPAPAAAAARALQPAMSAQERVALMPRHCTSGATDAQRARAGRVAKPAPNALSRRRALLAGAAAGLPAAVDNSLSHHFPPIGDQEGRASCVAWSVGYYWATYTQAMDEGLDVSGTWLPRDPECHVARAEPPVGAFVLRCTGQPDCPISSPDPANPGQHVWDGAKFDACNQTIAPPRPSRATEHIASPAFLYPLIKWAAFGKDGQWTTDDGGSSLWDGMNALERWGIGNWQSRPYDPWRFDDVVYGWPTEAQWIEALPRRTASSAFFDMTSPAGFDALKQHLANGGIAASAFIQYENVMHWGWDRGCQQTGVDCPGMNNDVLYDNGGKLSGGHAVTIVGYDDDRPYVDASGQNRRGALLMANSASPQWGVPNTAGGTSNGFFWVAYDYARAHIDAVTAEDRARYRPRLYAAGQLVSSQRTNGEVRAGLGVPALSFASFSTPDVLPHPDEHSPRAFAPDQRFIADFTDALPQFDLNGPLPVMFMYYAGPAGSSLGPVEFRLDRLGNGSFTRIAAVDPVRFIGVGAPEVAACNHVLQNGDVLQDGQVDRDDITAITLSMRGPALCRSDPRDIDRDGRITILDARKAMLRCAHPGCAK
ncbi:hypothetical protein [Aquabacterium humicola]|uniref:hypothetical protein n=1 Tax=Aquabacterium humicola TaxID=3237377 RepID=UPI00254288FF|nr:hypothetical protein [Rubrivivax pictus]